MTQSSPKIIAKILIATAAIWLYLTFTASSPQQTEIQSIIPKVSYLDVEYQQNPEMITAFAKVEALDPVSLDADVTAKINTLLVKNGSKIQKGDVIATFDQTDMKLNHAQIEESLKKIK